jgi:hypothetical protein
LLLPSFCLFDFNMILFCAFAYGQYQVEHMISEKNILLNLDHPFIVRLSGTFQG